MFPAKNHETSGIFFYGGGGPRRKSCYKYVMERVTNLTTYIPKIYQYFTVVTTDLEIRINITYHRV